MLKPPPHNERCTYENAIGHRCRNLKMSADCSLCPQHFRAQEKQRLRQQAIVHRATAAAERLAPAAAFANVLPHAAEKFAAEARNAIPGSVISINQMMERVLLMLMSNQLSARGATAAAAIFRLLLKAQPQVDAETILNNKILREEREYRAACAAQAAAEPATESAPECAVAPTLSSPAQPLDTADPDSISDAEISQLFEPSLAAHLIQWRHAQAAREARMAAAAHTPAATAAD